MIFLFLKPIQSTLYATLLKTLLNHSVPEIYVKDIPNIINPIFVDAREYNEFEVSHIDKAIWVGYNHFNIKAIEHLPHTTNIIVYCSVGYRSEKIVEKIQKLGFTKSYNLVGGIFEWKNQNKLVYSIENKPTNKVHTYNKIWSIWLNKGEKVY